MAKQQMTAGQALALACILFDFEIEQPQVTPPPPDWQSDLSQARIVLTEMLFQIEPAGLAGIDCGGILDNVDNLS